MKIGILALQGDVSEHVAMIRTAISSLGLDTEPLEVRRPAELEQVSALLMPGGESTTIAKQLKRFGLFQQIQKMAKDGMPVMGTCAGCILVASEIADYAGEEIEPLALMDITVNRNAFGRQKESFERQLDIAGIEGKFNGVFIRAPSIIKCGQEVEVLASLDGEPIMARQKKILALTFHPELTNDPRVHELFLKMI